MIFEYSFGGVPSSKESGIYEIHNTRTNRYYIGQTYRFEQRWKRHLASLRQQSQKCNKFLLRDYLNCVKLLGNDDFLSFRILLVMPNSTTQEREMAEEKLRQEYLLAHGRDRVYSFPSWSLAKENILPIEQEMASQAKRNGWAAKPESRMKQRIDQLQRLEDPAYRKQLSETSKQLWESAEYRAKMRENYEQNPNFGMTGKSQSEATKAKIGDANKGRPSPRKGKTLPDEVKEKMRKSQKERWARRKANSL